MQSPAFDPYYRWLGIPPQEQPPNHYRLLGLGLFESNPDVVETAADRQMLHVQTFKTGQHSAASQKILNELSAARLCLLNPAKKAAYDEQLKARLAAAQPMPTAEPVRQAIALEETPAMPVAAMPIIMPQIDGGTTSTGELYRAKRATSSTAIVLAALIGGLACVAAAVGFFIWRAQPVRPQLEPIAARTAHEGRPLELALRLKNADAVTERLEYHLLSGAPIGMHVDPQSGVLFWIPREEQGPGQYQVKVRAGLAETPSVFDEQSFNVSVEEVGQPPRLEPVDLRGLSTQSGALTLQLSAQDPDIPAGKLVYDFQIEPAAAKASIDAQTGLFTWRPSAEELGKSYQLTFKVSKQGAASLSDAQTLSFTLQGQTPTSPTASSAMSHDKLVADLQAAGAEVVFERVVLPSPFLGKQRLVRVNGQPVHTMEYADAAAADADLKRILSDPKTVVRAAGTVSMPVQFFRTDKLTAMYVGQEADLLDRLTRVLGKPAVAVRPAVAGTPGAPDNPPTTTSSPATTPSGSTTAPSTATAAKKKNPPPEPEAHKKALAEIEDLFADKLKSRKPDDRKALAQELVRQAAGTEALVSRYALLDKARELGVEANDVPTAWQAIDALAQDFELAALELKIDALKKGSGRTSTAADAHDHASRYLALIEQAIQEEQFDLGLPLVAPATNFAGKSKDLRLIERIKALGKDLRDLKKDFDGVQQARVTLKEKPDDAEANLVLGRYQCFLRDQWSEGLPRLVKSGDKTWSAVAKLDAASPTRPEEQTKAGDAWLDLAESAKASEREAVERRAAHWYRQALPMLSGLEKLKLERKLEKLPQPKGAESALATSSQPTVPAGLPQPQPPQPGVVRAPLRAPVITGLPPLLPPGAEGRDRRAAEVMVGANVASVHVLIKATNRSQVINRGKPGDIPQEDFFLERVQMTTKGLVGDQVLAYLRGLPQLKEVFMVNADYVTDAGVASLAELPACQSIHIGGGQVSDAGLASLGRLPALMNLTVHGGSFSDAGIARLTSLKTLRWLDLRGDNLTDAVFQAIAAFEGLESLQLESNRLTGQGLSKLAPLSNLRRLVLKSDNLSDQHLAQLGSLSSLETLNLQCKAPNVLSAVAACKSLRNLELFTPRISPDNLKELGGLPQLTNLSMYEAPPLTDTGVAHLAGIKTLEQLTVHHAELVTDAGLAHLAAMPALRSLTFSRSAQVTDKGLTQLAKLPQLSRLTLNDASQITNSGLANLKGAKSLVLVSVRGSRVTDEGVQDFKQALPNCTVWK